VYRADAAWTCSRVDVVSGKSRKKLALLGWMYEELARYWLVIVGGLVLDER